MNNNEINDLSYSMRRYHLDEFFINNITKFKKNSTILDMGGKKINKRGKFNIEDYSLFIKCANLDKKTEPDYLCDITKIPVKSNSFDGVILSEVLEHVQEPKLVLKEAFRLLKKGGKILICTPFIFHVHADPYDYARYTDYYYKVVLKKLGFKNIFTEKQGLFFSVLANMLKLWANELRKFNRPKSRLIKYFFHKFIFWFQKRALKWDKKTFTQENWLLSGYTTGYGIIAKKS